MPAPRAALGGALALLALPLAGVPDATSPARPTPTIIASAIPSRSTYAADRSRPLRRAQRGRPRPSAGAGSPAVRPDYRANGRGPMIDAGAHRRTPGAARTRGVKAVREARWPPAASPPALVQTTTYQAASDEPRLAGPPHLHQAAGQGAEPVRRLSARTSRHGATLQGWQNKPYSNSRLRLPDGDRRAGRRSARSRRARAPRAAPTSAAA